MMQRLAYLLFAVPLLCGADSRPPEVSQSAAGPPAALGSTPPAGYRDWRLVTMAHEAGDFNDLRAILGNDAAIKAFRRDQRPFPDGTVIARLAWQHESSAQNNAIFGRSQSFVAGAATNVQFMVKDSRKYAATDGWGFAQFNDGKAVAPAALSSCFPCHHQIKDQDLVFSHYSK